MNMNSNFLTWLKAMCSAFFLLTLIGCHGGIFGTGDGNAESGLPEMGGDVGDENPGGTDGSDADSTADGGTDSGTDGTTGDTEPGATDGTDAGTTGGVDGGTDSGTSGGTDGSDGADGSDGGSSTDPVPVPFENTTPTTSRSDALIVVVNGSEQSLLVTTISGNETELPREVISPLAFSSHVVLDPALVHNIQFYDGSSSSSNALYQLTPVTLSPGTVSTLVARSLGGSLDLSPLATQTTTSDSTLARIRLVQTDSFGDALQEADFTLLSGGNNPGGGEHTFNSISYANPIGEYTELPAGDYILSDSLSRIGDQTLSFTGGSSVTLIVTGASGVGAIIFDDSNINITP